MTAVFAPLRPIPSSVSKLSAAFSHWPAIGLTQPSGGGHESLPVRGPDHPPPFHPRLAELSHQFRLDGPASQRAPDTLRATQHGLAREGGPPERLLLEGGSG